MSSLDGKAHTVHATCIETDDCGVLLLGPSGSGKSQLALRMIDAPGAGVALVPMSTHLIGDDQIVLMRAENRLVASAAPALSGKLEVRGLGIVPVKARASAVVSLAVELCPGGPIERMPESGNLCYTCLGIDVPMIKIDPESASAPAVLRTAICCIPVLAGRKAKGR